MLKTLGFKGQTIRVMSYRLHVYVRITLRHWTGKWQWMQLNKIVWVIAETWKREGIFWFPKQLLLEEYISTIISFSYSFGSMKTNKSYCNKVFVRFKIWCNDTWILAPKTCLECGILISEPSLTSRQCLQSYCEWLLVDYYCCWFRNVQCTLKVVSSM